MRKTNKMIKKNYTETLEKIQNFEKAYEIFKQTLNSEREGGQTEPSSPIVENKYGFI